MYNYISASRLLQPSDRVLSLMQPILDEMQSVFIVAVQLRAEYLMFGQDELFYRCFEEISQNVTLTGGKPTKLFLTTDNEEVRCQSRFDSISHSLHADCHQF